MEVVPLITMKHWEIVDFEEEIKKLSEEQILYIYDLDGIEKDKPNLCTFQRLSKDLDIWVDSGPRDLGDVVDLFLAGAKAVTIRKNLFPNLDISKIREISENKVYIKIDYKENIIVEDPDGFINFEGYEKLQEKFEYSSLLNNYAKRKNVYTYDSEIKNINFWKKQGFERFVVDLDKFEEFKKYGL